MKISLKNDLVKCDFCYQSCIFITYSHLFFILEIRIQLFTIVVDIDDNVEQIVSKSISHFLRMKFDTPKSK